jgi:Tfp pilus assembly protein PilW
MAIALDIIGSLAIRGAIILTILQLNISLQQTLTLKTATANVRENLATMVSIIETDIRQAGYDVSSSQFLTSDTSDVKFRADLLNDGTTDTVRIYRSGSEVYRQVNSGTALRIGIGVTQLKFTYYTSTGTTTTTPSAVKSLKWNVSMEENFTITGTGDGQTYRPSAQSEFQVYPENL